MSIPMIIRLIDQSEIDQLAKEPESFDDFFFGPWDSIEVPKPKGLFSFLKKQTPSAPPTRRLWSYLGGSAQEKARIAALPGWKPKSPAADELLDIDKSYEFLHAAFSGRMSSDPGNTPRDLFLMDDARVRTTESGSPWWCLHPEEGLELRDVVESMTPSALRTRLSGEFLEKDPILQEIVEDSSYDEVMEYVEIHLSAFKVLFARAIERKKGLLMVIVV